VRCPVRQRGRARYPHRAVWCQIADGAVRTSSLAEASRKRGAGSEVAVIMRPAGKKVAGSGCESAPDAPDVPAH
jgi:hypothetical protein